jgi:hypothetical protein
MKTRRPLRLVAALIACAALLGCGGPVALPDRKIEAGSGAQLLSWRGRVLESYPKAERTEFDDALQELRIAEMIGETLSTPSQLDERVRRKIDGKPVRQILLDAYAAKQTRLEEEVLLLRGVIELNAAREPVNREAAERLEFHLQQEVKRLDGLEAELTRIRRRCAELKGALLTPPTSSPEGGKGGSAPPARPQAPSPTA